MKGLRIALVLAALAACPVASAAGTLVVPPRTFPGPYAVGCSDLAQDFTRGAPSEDVQDFWEGVARRATSRTCCRTPPIRLPPP
jgi:hypothetical protein